MELSSGTAAWNEMLDLRIVCIRSGYKAFGVKVQYTIEAAH